MKLRDDKTWQDEVAQAVWFIVQIAGIVILCFYIAFL